MLKKVEKQRIKEIADKLDNIIFLDYDGVLNIAINNNGEKRFSLECINNLNKLCNNYNFQIVVISSWRKSPKYKEMLYASGLDKNIIIKGRIDCLNDGTTREEKIIRYLKENIYIDKFLILDDGPYEKLANYQVRTDFNKGFNHEKYEETIKLLSK